MFSRRRDKVPLGPVGSPHRIQDEMRGSVDHLDVEVIVGCLGDGAMERHVEDIDILSPSDGVLVLRQRTPKLV